MIKKNKIYMNKDRFHMMLLNQRRLLKKLKNLLDKELKTLH